MIPLTSYGHSADTGLGLAIEQTQALAGKSPLPHQRRKNLTAEVLTFAKEVFPPG